MRTPNYQNKMRNMNTIKLELNADMRGHRKGSIIEVQTDHKQVPLDPYWRARLKDAEIDNSVKVIKPSRKKKMRKLNNDHF